MKTMKIVDEADFMLTEETRNDKALKPIDLDVLAVCQYVANYKQLDYDRNGWFILPLARNAKIKSTSLQEYLKQWGVSVSDDTVRRSINKLRYLGYLEYKKGYYHGHSDSQLAEIKILKGTVSNLIQSEASLTSTVSPRYEDIAVATYTNTESETKTKEESFNIGTYRGGDDKCSSSTCEEEQYLDTSSTLEEEHNDDLQEYVPDLNQRSNVRSWLRICGKDGSPVLDQLLIGYRWEAIDVLPLLGYLMKHQSEEEYTAIFKECWDNDEDIATLNTFCKNIGYTPPQMEDKNQRQLRLYNEWLLSRKGDRSDNHIPRQYVGDQDAAEQSK